MAALMSSAGIAPPVDVDGARRAAERNLTLDDRREPPAGTLMSAFIVSTPVPVVIRPPCISSVVVDRLVLVREVEPTGARDGERARDLPRVSSRTMSAIRPPLALPALSPAGTEIAGSDARQHDRAFVDGGDAGIGVGRRADQRTVPAPVLVRPAPPESAPPSCERPGGRGDVHDQVRGGGDRDGQADRDRRLPRRP